MITIVDYGMGNLGSIANMIKYMGSEYVITSSVEKIGAAEKIILPGVGSFDYGMEKLKELNLLNVLNEKALNEKVPVLGICLGMQLMTKKSEEGQEAGLGWINATTNKFKENDAYRIPNMGWNYIDQHKKSNLFNLIDEDARFYFVHSYYVECKEREDVLFTSNYGFDYVCGFEKKNIYGVQFHPEKSHRFGKELIGNFIKI